MMHRSIALVLLALSLTAGPAAGDIVTGLIASYPMDGNANDVSGNGNHGTLVGGIAGTTDRFGAPNGAYEFNGLDSYIYVPSSPSLDSPATELTQAAWVMVYGNSKVGAANFAPITMKSVDATNAFMYRMLATPSTFGASYNNWFNGASTNATLPADEWHHLATVFDGSNVAFYLDGTLVDTQPLALVIASDSRAFTIGADFPGVPEYFWGKLDDVRLYGRALSGPDIAELAGGATAVGDLPSPSGMRIDRSLPNPTHGQTAIEFHLDAPRSVRLEVYDTSGRRLRVLASGRLSSGRHSVVWDGFTDSGAPTPAGLYFLRLEGDGPSVTRRIVRVR